MKHSMHGKKLFGTATVGTKGQIVIPANAREELNLKPGDKLYIAGSIEKKVLFCLKEEQLEDIIAHLTADAENAKNLIDELKKEG
jgi:AbrB family looped-hinge helix DNA binding protein